MEYTIGLEELIKRQIVRTDQSYEFLNKMTDVEIRQWEKEVEQSLLEAGTVKKFPDWNAAFLSKTIDKHTMYTIMKEQTQKPLTDLLG